LNPNSILQIAVFVHLCEVYLGIPPHFTLFKHYFFLKYQPSATNRQVTGGVGIQARPNRNFLCLPLKTSLKSWHKQWFYCKNHEPSLPIFVGLLPEYQGSWTEEPTTDESSEVQALSAKVSQLKVLGLTGVSVVANWLARRVVPLKKQVHPGWEYYGPSIPTREDDRPLIESQLHRLLEEMFQSTDSWPIPKQVRPFNLSVARDVVSYLALSSFFQVLMLIGFF
jgi:hypothetical protein